MSGENGILEFEVMGLRGTRRWLETHAAPMRDAAGEVVKLLGVTRDITGRKHAEGALRQAEEKYRSIFENAVAGIYQTKTDGHYVSANPTLALILGYASPDELIASVRDLNHQFYVEPNRREEFIRLIGEQSAVLGFESQVYRKDGSVIWISETGRGIRDADGDTISFEGITIDITERKRAEEEIKLKNEQLIKLNSEKDKFFSIIAHDLRSPFQGFLGMTEMMTENIGEFSNEEIVTYIGELNKSAQNLYKLLQNLLDWAQLKKGSFSFTPEEFSLSKIVSASIEQINKRAIQKGITIINEVPVEQKVFVDERMINSILGNLLSNAVKFTRKEGTVTIKAKTISNGMVEIAVEDTGVGISERVVNKLFKIDEKVGSKGTDGEKSTGLGLLLCKEFVEKHGGRIWVESEEGKGSSFYFTISKGEGSNL
jgi:PAS domain S-box-containing protein